MTTSDVMTIPAVVNCFGISLVYFVAQGTIAIAVLYVLLLLVGDLPRVRHTLAWLTLMVMAACIPVTMIASLIIAVNHPSASHMSTTLAKPLFIRPSNDVATAVSTQSNDDVAKGMISGSQPLPFYPSASPISSFETKDIGFSELDLSASVSPIAPWITALWGIGVVVIGFFQWVGWRRLQNILRVSIDPVPDSIRECANRLAARLMVQTHFDLRMTSVVMSPAVVGWFRPIVLLPAGIISGLSAEQVEMILAHELAHLRRYDHIAHLLQIVIESCLFYHPAVWWVSRQIRIEREACCDDLASRITSGPVAYARVLARVEEIRRSFAERNQLRFGLASNGGVLLPRIRRLVGLPRQEHRSKSAASGIVSCGIAALFLCWIATGNAESVLSDPPASKVDAPKQKIPDVNASNPRVIEVSPAEGAKDISPETELRIRFDQPMDPAQIDLMFYNSSEAGYRINGDIRYDLHRNEFIIPVRLTPNKTPTIQVNSKERRSPFTSMNGNSADPFQWSFAVGADRFAEVPQPTVIDIRPKNDSEVACYTPVHVRFDRPMNPASFVSVTSQTLGSFGPETTNHFIEISWSEDRTTANFLLKLPPNWNGVLNVVGLQTQEKALVPPISISYRTLQKFVANEIMDRVNDPSTQKVATAILEKMIAARRSIRSGAVTTTIVSATGGGIWSTGLSSESAHFVFQGDSKFVGDVSRIMGIRFRIGGDGTVCWFEHENDLIETSATQIDELQIRSAFDDVKESTDEVIAEQGPCEVIGKAIIRGRDCFQLRFWIPPEERDPLSTFKDVFVDSTNFLPVRIQNHVFQMTYDFEYSKINEIIPASTFQPSPTASTKRKPLDELKAGYDKRFLILDDGTCHGVSLRWGMLGKGGSSSSGLN